MIFLVEDPIDDFFFEDVLDEEDMVAYMAKLD